MTAAAATAAGNSRLDKWLWFARLFKTRSLAMAAVKGGKVHVNGARAKPARDVKPGDMLEITRGPGHLELMVRCLAQRRGPAAEAQSLYEETAASIATRAERTTLRKIRALDNPAPAKRPDKKSRRQIIRFVRKGG